MKIPHFVISTALHIFEKSLKLMIQPHTTPNRAQRRQEAKLSNQKFSRPVINNRVKTKARKGNRLFIKMANFAMQFNSKLIAARGI